MPASPKKSLLTATALTGLALTYLLSGCGASPAGVKPAPTKPDTPVLQPVAPPDATDPEAKEALKALREAVPVVNTIAGKQHSWQYLPDNTFDYCKADIALKRSAKTEPFTLAAYVFDAKDKRVERTKMVFDGKSSIRLKTYFLGFLAVKATIAYNDPRIVDPYKRTFRDTSLDQMLAVVMHPDAKTRKMGTFMLRGERLTLVEVKSPAMWKDVSKEIFGLSEKNGMPIYRDTYLKSGKLFRHFDIEGLKLNPKLAPSNFDVDSQVSG